MNEEKPASLEINEKMKKIQSKNLTFFTDPILPYPTQILKKSKSIHKTLLHPPKLGFLKISQNLNIEETNCKFCNNPTSKDSFLKSPNNATTNSKEENKQTFFSL